MKVPQLRKILADRGIFRHGKRHAELVELAGEAVKTHDAMEDCDHDNSERRRKLVTDAGGTIFMGNRLFGCMTSEVYPVL